MEYQKAVTAVENAFGPTVDTTTITIWTRGITRPDGGQTVTIPWSTFAESHRSQAQRVMPKGQGPLYSPTTNADGHRSQASTMAVHQLVLDCDGAGPWDTIKAALDYLGAAYVLHETSGATDTLYKWRLCLPLSRWFDTSTPELRAAWRTVYGAARLAFGLVGGLTGEFDPSTDGCERAFYLGHRPAESSRPRRVEWRAGRTLDLDRLTGLTPTKQAPQVVRRESRAAARRASGGEPFLLALAFEEAGWLGHEIETGKYAVTCPWDENHSSPIGDGPPDSSSILFAPAAKGGGPGWFYCSHGHCRDRKGWRGAIEKLPRDAIEKARSRMDIVRRSEVENWLKAFGRGER